MQETYKKAILNKRARKRNHHSLPTASAGLDRAKAPLTQTTIKPLYMLFMEPMVGFLSLHVAFVYSILCAFFEAYPIVFIDQYGFTASQCGLAFIGIALGVLLGSLTLLIIDRRIYRRKVAEAHSKGREAAPEHRLYAAMFGGVGITVAMFWFAWTARPSIHWIVPMMAGVPFAWGNICIFVS